MIFWRNKRTDTQDKQPAFRVEAPPRIDEAGAPRKEILVVDDDPVILKALSLKLESKGYRVVPAKDGAEAIQATRRNRPDLMLMDVNFPHEVDGVSWDGFGIAQWLRRLRETKDTPVIMMSGTIKPEHTRRATALGARGVLAKPINCDALIATIGSALSAPRCASDAETGTSLDGDKPKALPGRAGNPGGAREESPMMQAGAL